VFDLSLQSRKQIHYSWAQFVFADVLEFAETFLSLEIPDRFFFWGFSSSSVIAPSPGVSVRCHWRESSLKDAGREGYGYHGDYVAVSMWNLP